MSAFEAFAARWTPALQREYEDRLATAIGHRYTYATAPLFLPRALLARLEETVHAMVRLLAAPGYQRLAAQEPWFLEPFALRRRDLFGCVDFHLAGDELKVIEVNLNPPGRFGLHELMEAALLEVFDTPTRARPNAGFERAVVEAVSACAPGGRVAIAVNPTASSRELRPHYRYVERCFERHGVEAKVVFADAVELGRDGRPRWDGTPYDVVLNLLIARTWKDNPRLFARFTELYRRRPEIFFPAPFGARLGDKRLLAMLDRLGEEDFGLAAADVETLRRAALPATRLDGCASASEVEERFGGVEQLVLKPFDDYRGNGVVVRPTRDRLEEIFARRRHEYVAQGFFPPRPAPCLTADGRLGEHPFEIRVVFLDGEVRSLRGSSCIDLDMTPAVVV